MNNKYEQDYLEFMRDEYETTFGSYVTTLYIKYDKYNAQENAEAFLYLFKRLIDEGLILAHAPINGEPEKEIQGDQFWDVSSDRMIEYIRSVLPSDPEFLWSSLDDKDDEWGKFWYYDCPQIRWVDKETGQIY